MSSEKQRQGKRVAERRIPCPCCFYLTLEERGEYEICSICAWEDDGQDDETADEVWGGPNSDLSLTQARYNFARIGACDWYALQHWPRGPTPDRAAGFPFSTVNQLPKVPSIGAWPEPWTLSFHSKGREVASRWREAVELLSERSYQFNGIYESKSCDRRDWTHPRVRKFIHLDEGYSVDTIYDDKGNALVGAWFEFARVGGALLRVQSVYEFGDAWNEPAISIDAFLPEEDADRLFEELVHEKLQLIASQSKNRRGLPTISEMSTDFSALPFVYGRTFLMADLTPSGFPDAFREELGRQSVTEVPGGFLIARGKVPWWRTGTDEQEDRAYVFFKDEFKKLAASIVANRTSSGGGLP